MRSKNDHLADANFGDQFILGLVVKKKGEYQLATYQNSVHGGLYVSEIVLIGVWTVAKNTE